MTTVIVNHDEAKPPGLPFYHPQGPLGDLGSSPLPFSSASSWESGFTLFSSAPCHNTLPAFCMADAQYRTVSTWACSPELALPPWRLVLARDLRAWDHGSVLLELSLPGLTHEHQWAWLRAEETFCGCPLVDATLTLLSLLVAFLQLAAPGHLRLCGPRVAVQPPQMPSRPEEMAWRELCGTLSSPSDPSHGRPHGGRVPSPSRFPGPRPSRLEEARPFIHSRGVHLLWTSHGYFSGEVTEGSGLAEVLRR